MSKNQEKSPAHKSRGRVKEEAGRTGGSDEMQRDARKEHTQGSVQKRNGNIQGRAGKAST